MKNNVSAAEATPEEDELPGMKQEEVKVEEVKTEDVKAEPKEQIKVEPEKEIIPENLESDEEFAFFKTEEKKEEEVKEKEVKEEVKTDEEIFSEKLFEEEAKENAKAEEVKTDPFVTEFLTETKDILGEIEVRSAKELATVVKNAVANATTKTEIDTSRYTSDQIALHEHLSTEKGIIEFADIAKPFIQFFAKNDDEKVESYLIHEKGITDPAKIQEEFERLVETNEWDNTVKTVNTLILDLQQKALQERIDKITEESKTVQSANSTLVIKEQNELLKAIDDTNEFMGIPIPDTFKAKIKKEIADGLFTKKNNNAQTQIKARLYDLVGAQIIDQKNRTLENEKAEAYARGLRKGQGALHNTPPVIDKPGHSIAKDVLKNQLEGFRNIDDDAIDNNK